jgi:hypothetical protein
MTCAPSGLSKQAKLSSVEAQDSDGVNAVPSKSGSILLLHDLDLLFFDWGVTVLSAT